MGNTSSSTPGDGFNPYLLKDQERKLLCQKWPVMMREKPDLFTTTWLKALDRSPAIKETFGVKGDQDPRENQSFIRLTMAVEAFFHRLIVNWSLEEDKIRTVCVDLGAKHITYIARGFHAIFWDVFMVCLMDTIENSELQALGKKRAKLMHAYQKLVHTVVEYMREGYTMAQMQQGNVEASKNND